MLLALRVVRSVVAAVQRCRPQRQDLLSPCLYVCSLPTKKPTVTFAPLPNF